MKEPTCFVSGRPGWQGCRAPRKLAQGVFAFTGLCVLLTACAEEPSAIHFPDVEGWTGEPQVAAKIRQVREQALEAPRSAQAAGRLGMVFHAHDLHPEAIVCYQHAMKLAPEEARWPYLSGLATATTDLEASVVDFERALALGLEQPALHVNFGDILTQLGRFEEAEEHYRRALELGPETTHALYGLAQLALGRGDPEAAAEHLEEAVRIAPWYREVYTLLAQVYQRLGRSVDAERELLRAGAYPEIHRTPDPILDEVQAEAVSSLVYRRHGQQLADDGRFVEAEAQFRKVLEIDSNTARDFSNLGGALTGQGKLDEAIEQYEKALELAPEDTFALNNLSMALADRGDLTGAAERLVEAVTIDPSYADAHRNLGLVRTRQGRREEAITHYRQALAANPSLAVAHNDLGTALAQQGKREEAAQHWRQALEIDPRELSALYNLSVALVQRGEHREAVRWLRRGTELAPNSSRLIALLAWELATAPDEGVRDGAAAELLARRVYNNYPDQAQIGDVLAVALASQYRFDEAIPIAERALAQAESGGQNGLAAQIQLRLKLYRQQQPFDQSLLPSAPPRRRG